MKEKYLKVLVIFAALFLIWGCTGKPGSSGGSGDFASGGAAASGEAGSLGEAGTPEEEEPDVPIPNTWKVVYSSNHSCALAMDNSVWCWGMGSSGQMGRGNVQDSNMPRHVKKGNDFAVISVGQWHTCGIKTDGTLWCWGQNDLEWRQLGTSDGCLFTAPCQVGADNNWAQVDSSQRFNCALKKDKTMWCWGANEYGQLGDGSTVNRPTPAPGFPGNDWLEVRVAGGFTCAMRQDGSIWCSGDNLFGQLGDGTTTERHTPVQAGRDTDWNMFGLGAPFVLATKDDNTLWVWGACPDWWAGGHETCGPTPHRYTRFSNFHFVAGSAGKHTCLIMTDGSLACLGKNEHGQLGDGTFNESLVLKPVEPGSKWKFVSAGEACTCGIKDDDTLWCWGRNQYGAVGDGTNEDRNVPTKIITGIIPPK